MSAEPWPKIRSSTLADQVYEAVRDRILDGELEPGEFAREQELSDAMGVSRTPVREALGRLASEGFLERIPHRGFRIPAQAVSRILELYPIVSALELLAGRLAFPSVTEEDIERLREINQRLRDAVEEEDVTAAIQLNEEFHALVAERSNNQSLVELLDDLRMQIRRLETWYYSYGEYGKQSIREHDSLIKALETGQLQRALNIFERNMASTLYALLEESGDRPSMKGAVQAAQAFEQTAAASEQDIRIAD